MTFVDYISAARTEPAVRVTAQQRAVLNHLANGRTYDEIADALGVAPGTVRTHIKRLYRTLGVHNRLEAVICGCRNGLVDLDRVEPWWGRDE